VFSLAAVIKKQYTGVSVGVSRTPRVLTHLELYNYFPNQKFVVFAVPVNNTNVDLSTPIRIYTNLTGDHIAELCRDQVGPLFEWSGCTKQAMIINWTPSITGIPNDGSPHATPNASATHVHVNFSTPWADTPFDLYGIQLIHRMLNRWASFVDYNYNEKSIHFVAYGVLGIQLNYLHDTLNQYPEVKKIITTYK
jgi:hypothetical protein